MISLNSILSPTQGNLHLHNRTEDDYYRYYAPSERFAVTEGETAIDVPQRHFVATKPRFPRFWTYLEFDLHGMWGNPGK